MAPSNRERVQRGLELLRGGLAPFVERELKSQLGEGWLQDVNSGRRHALDKGTDGNVAWDTHALLVVMWDEWNRVFRTTLGQSQRTLVSELRNVRNDWAHDSQFSTNETYRALDSAKLLLEAIAAPEEAREVEKQAEEVLRLKYAEQARSRSRRVEAAEGKPQEGLPPWREVITPHADVSSGRYAQAEFAADLAQVYRGEGSDEYRDPGEFFQRTFLTEGLKHLLANALRRLSREGGDPVLELQTNFGGGKTHSMLALYHLFAGTGAEDLSGVEELLREQGLGEVPEARRAVLVGYSLSPGQTRKKDDGTEVGTLWGELAWQLGGADGYRKVAEADASGTSPGSEALAELFNECGPCLILIDEWVAFLRNLYGVRGLPAGSFESNLTFAQALTQAAAAVPGTLVVASLPASTIEIGGEGGEEALEQLKHTFGRMESTWKPATAEEGFEIVRRRLFQEDTENQAARDMVVKKFGDLYRAQSGTFPSGCNEGAYRSRVEAAYPIHPELFDRLHNDWASLDKFQRTRGVLRLMAAVIHALWEGEDKNLLIMPSSVPMENTLVRDELTRYMEEPWDAVISKDVDGPSSLPLELDRDNPNLGRYSACRRIARTIYLGSAPTSGAATPGLDEKNVLLGCIQPGEAPATFGDALRRLTDQSTYLYVDGRRLWYSTQPSVTRLARDRAEELDDYEVREEVKRRLRADRDRGEFAGVHFAPDSSADVPDDTDARLVVLGPEYPHVARAEDSEARQRAEATLDAHGSSPRLNKNTLVFLAADRRRLEELEGRVRQMLAWGSVEREAESLNLTRFATNQAATKRSEAEGAVDSQLREAWCWCLVPEQPDPLGAIEWSEARLQGQDGPAKRASKKLVNDEHLFPVIGPARLKMELDRNLWRDADHLVTKQLWEYFCRFVYLPRLKDRGVLLKAIEDGVDTVVSSAEFAYAEGYDEATGSYRGLKMGGGGSVSIDSNSFLVKPEVAQRQLDEQERKSKEEEGNGGGKGTGGGGRAIGPRPAPGGEDEGEDPPDEKPQLPNRVHASASLDPDRVGRDAGKIADEILSHLSALPGSRLQVSIEIEAELPEGVSEEVRRTVSENADTLGLDSYEFYRE